MGDYSTLEKKLASQLEELERRATKIERDLRRPGDKDWTERASERENDEVLEGLDAHGREKIAEIRRTLSRIESGTFGRCANCAAKIPAERLEALPWTQTCLSCAK
jgi:RNA polymerase-binding transcription factor DksA